jgi:serine/threonine-protein kinase
MNLPSRYTPTGKTFGGGQGVVSVWFDGLLGRNVAIKALSPHGIGGSLRHEAALLGSIKSKHVVELLDICLDSTTGEEYLVMEYIDGSELSAFRPTSLNDLYLNLYQITTGLNDIHASRCIHRDIKPENLKHDSNNVVKIIDFGIGTNLTPALTLQGRGSNGFRGAEYFSNPIQLTAATDIYAFGSTSYQIIFGALHYNHYQAPPLSPPSFSGAVVGASLEQIHPEISSQMDRCFAADPDHRPSAGELQNLFAKHLLHGRHVGHFVHSGTSYFLDHSKTSYKITGGRGSFFIVYDNLDFLIRQPTGEVFIHGATAVDRSVLPKSCVITIGQGSGPGRTFIPFNVSHPEVIL